MMIRIQLVTNETFFEKKKIEGGICPPRLKLGPPLVVGMSMVRRRCLDKIPDTKHDSDC